MPYSYGEFGKWELDEDDGILACSLYWADDNSDLHIAILVLNRNEYLLYVNKDDSDNMEALFTEARTITHCRMISCLDDKSVIVNFCNQHLIFRKDQYEVISGTLSAFGVDTRAESSKQISSIDLDNMSGVDFEKLILDLVLIMGFEARTTKTSGDGGIDIIAYNNKPLLEGKYIFQCKRWNSSVGEPVLRDLYGVVMSERANKGILVTAGSFTSSAIAFAQDKPLELIDGDKLKYLLANHDITPQVGNTCGFDISNWIDEEEFDNYTILRNELSINHKNHEARYKIICIFMNRIMNNIFYSHKSTRDEMDLIILECRKHISILESCQLTSKRELGIKYITLYFDAQLYILQGDLFNAIKKFLDVLDWKPIRWTYPMNTNGHGSYKYPEALFPIINNIIQIYCTLDLYDKANSFIRRHEKVFDDISKETVWYASIDKYDDFTVYKSVKEVDFHKTTDNIIKKVRNCNGDFLIFWNNLNYTFGNGSYNIYDDDADLYFFRFETQYHFAYNKEDKLVGVIGYPRWSDSIIRDLKSQRKKISLLF